MQNAELEEVGQLDSWTQTVGVNALIKFLQELSLLKDNS